MSKTVYMVVDYKVPGILRESLYIKAVISSSDEENLVYVVEKERARGAWAMNICKTKKQAEDIVTMINDSYREQERYGWRNSNHAEEIYSDGILITEDIHNNFHRVIDVCVGRYIENIAGPILRIDSGKVTELNDVPGLTRHAIGVANAVIEKYAPQHEVRFGEHVKEEK